jgi:hypothetical protein
MLLSKLACPRAPRASVLASLFAMSNGVPWIFKCRRSCIPNISLGLYELPGKDLLALRRRKAFDRIPEGRPGHGRVVVPKKTEQRGTRDFSGLPQRPTYGLVYQVVPVAKQLFGDAERVVDFVVAY